MPKPKDHDKEIGLGLRSRLKKYVKELESEAVWRQRHRGSPVTSMSEDIQINAIGSEQQKIVDALKRMLKTTALKKGRKP